MKLILNPEYNLYEKDNKVFCDSLQIAETFNKRHADVLRTIEKMTDIKSGLSEDFRQRNFTQSYYINEQNKKQPMFLMTKNGFSIITMGFTGKKAMQFKEMYIKRFEQMEEFIKSLLTAKLEFPDFTNAIMNAHEEPKHYHFSNEINMINKIVLGLTAKEFKEQNGIDKDVGSIRPYLDNNQIKHIEALQKFDIGLVTVEEDYQRRKETLIDYYNKISNIKLLSA